jgi:peptidoglycan-associated lipoprotein
MPHSFRMSKIALLGLFAALAACTTKPVEPPHLSSSTTTATAPIASAIVPGSARDFTVNVGDTVHFAYDKSEIAGEDRGTLQRQAAWLQKYPMVRVTVSGNCDERGTREYNLALGARRAEAVKEFLTSLGVAAARIETISYGKERPVCTTSDEDCWAQNRRAVTGIANGAASS